MSGENLFIAAQLMEKAGKELDTMLEALGKIIEEELSDIGDIAKSSLGDDDSNDPSAWVRLGYLQNWDIYHKHKKKPIANLAIQVTLIDDDSKIVGNTPLVYVLYAGGEWEYNEFQLGNIEDYTLRNEKLWEYFEEDENVPEKPEEELSWENRSWAFVLPLVSLCTDSELHSQIVDPVKKLFQGETPDQAFAAADKVMRFSVENGQAQRL